MEDGKKSDKGSRESAVKGTDAESLATIIKLRGSYPKLLMQIVGMVNG